MPGEGIPLPAFALKMHSPIRTLFYAVTMCVGFAIKAGWFAPEMARQASLSSVRPPAVAVGADSIAIISNPESASTDNPNPVASDGNDELSSASCQDIGYRAISERNIFGLKLLPVVNAPQIVAINAVHDLVLTGLCDLGGIRRAMFQVIEPGKPTSSYVLQEGEQNEWLEIRSIDAGNGRVTVFLKKPVMRIRNAGIEVVLSFQIHGAQR